jgi:predicted acylesterase/phospholipase RssA
MDTAVCRRLTHLTVTAGTDVTDLRAVRRRLRKARFLHPLAWRAASWHDLLGVTARLEAVQHAPDLRTLQPREILALARAATARWASEGELYAAGVPATALVLVGPGAAAEVETETGHRAVLGPGSMLGWSAWRRAQLQLPGTRPPRFHGPPRGARIARAGWVLEWDVAALRDLAGRTGLVRGQWLARWMDERTEIHRHAEEVVRALAALPSLRDVPEGALYTLLQSSSLVRWRAGAPPPVPVGLSAGLTVVLEGELVGYRLLPRMVAHSVHAVRLHPFRVVRPLGVMGSPLAELVPGDEHGSAISDSAQTRWQSRGPAHSLFIAAERCTEALGDLPSFQEALARQRETLRHVQADKRFTDALDVRQGTFHDALNLQWVGRAGPTHLEPIDPAVALLERLAATIWQGFADRTLLVEWVAPVDDQSLEPEVVAEGDGWVRLRAPANAWDVLDRLQQLVEHHAEASHVLTWEGPGTDLEDRLARAADGVMVLNRDPSAPVPRDLHHTQGLLYASLVRVARGQGLPPTAIRLHALTEGTHAPVLGYAGQAQALGRWARAVTFRRVGVALGGGGAWGWAHVSLLSGMARMGVPVDIISGVSFGATAGAFYGIAGDAGLAYLVEHDRQLKQVFQRGYLSARGIARYFDRRLPHMEAWAAARLAAKVQGLHAVLPAKDQAEFSTRFTLPPPNGWSGGLFAGMAEAMGDLPDALWQDREGRQLPDLPSRADLLDALAVLHGLYGLRDPSQPERTDLPLEHLPIPFLPVATELVSGSPTPMLATSVGVGVRASGALPPFFPVARDEEGTYIDGAMTYNVPSAPLHLEGAALLVASNIVPPSIMRAPAPVRQGPAALLSDVNLVRRALMTGVGLQTLFNTSGLVTTGLDPVLFETAWNGTLFFQVDRAEQVVQDTYSSPGFWQAQEGLQRRWNRLREPRGLPLTGTEDA